MENALLFNIATIFYLIAMVLYISYLAFRKEGVGIAASVATVVGFGIQTIALVSRWAESYQKGIGRVPLTNLYESLVFFTWSTVLIYLIVERKYRTRAFGAFVMPVAFLALAFINVTGMSADITPLVPALQSNWLLYHVLVSFLGYAAFAVAFGVSMTYLLGDMEDRGSAVNLYVGIAVIAVLALVGYVTSGAGHKVAFWLGAGVLILAWFIYLIVAGASNKQQVYLFWTFCVTLAVSMLVAMGADYALFRAEALPEAETFKTHMFESTFLSVSIFVRVVCWLGVFGIFWLVWSRGMQLKKLLAQYLPSLDMLDDLTYRMIAIGWPLLTAGIITGAVWANSAWGTYWSWDPKETWSLITWFIYAIYLHARYVRGWKGTQMAVISAVGFLAVIFTYLGVNLVLSGLHSYGSME
jgi:cytochrome c-type biogenesis protein CcsB